MFRTIVGIGINKNMLPWKDSSLWSWPQTLPFASQRFSENLIERLHSSLPPSMGSFCIPPWKNPYSVILLLPPKFQLQTFLHQAQNSQNQKVIWIHTSFLPPLKKQHVPTPNFRPSTYQLHPHSHLKGLNGTFSAVGSTGISSKTPAGYHHPSASRKVLGHTSGRKCDKVGKSAVALSVFFTGF